MNEPGTAKRRFRRAPDEKRARIAAVARACFSSKPYEATTTAEIARRADVSEGTIFHHFGSKHGLLLVVARAYAHDLATTMFEGMAAMRAGGMLEVVDEIEKRTRAFLEEEGVVGLVPGKHRDDAVVETVLTAIREHIVEGGSKLLDAWRAQNVTRPLDARPLAEVLYPIFEEHFLRRALAGEPPLQDAVLREVALVFEGAIDLRRDAH